MIILALPFEFEYFFAVRKEYSNLCSIDPFHFVNSTIKLFWC